MDFFVRNFFSFLLDPLALLFLATILLVSLPALIYSFGYLKGENSPKKIFFTQVITMFFILCMGLVVTAGNILLFLVAWELMSLTSYFLVLSEYRHEPSIRAATIYLVMTHIATAFLIAAFMMMFRYCHSYNFADLRSACLLMPAALRNQLFIFLLIGFGTKAGVVPLHIWLPYAHPQAPSQISSIMSGVMIKTAIYGIVRFVIYILGANTLWWGVLIITLAAITALVGVIYAVAERDIKRLLAYSSVENIGIILFGVGMYLLFNSMGLFYLAVFALAAGLFHLINHAAFKGLLFLCAGSVYKACGTRDMEKMGGLIKKMPWTAACFLIGALAISAIPPLNGFVSEWLTLQAFVQGAINSHGGIAVFLGISAAMLAITSGLAAACFVKAFGLTFLAIPRSRQSQGAKECGLSMKIGMLMLSAAVVVLGMVSGFVMKLLIKVCQSVSGIDVTVIRLSTTNFTLSPLYNKGAHLSLPLIAMLLALMLLISFGIYFAAGRRKSRVYNTWDCGYYQIGSRNEYSATGFAKPFSIAFSFFLRPYRRTQKIRESFYHVKSFSYETYTTKVFKKYAYDPALSIVFKSARYVRRIQQGSIQFYIGYIFLTLLLLIIFMRKF